MTDIEGAVGNLLFLQRVSLGLGKLDALVKTGQLKPEALKTNRASDHRPDCEQIVNALIVNSEGFLSWG